MAQRMTRRTAQGTVQRTAQWLERLMWGTVVAWLGMGAVASAEATEATGVGKQSWEAVVAADLAETTEAGAEAHPWGTAKPLGAWVENAGSGATVASEPLEPGAADAAETLAVDPAADPAADPVADAAKPEAAPDPGLGDEAVGGAAPEEPGAEAVDEAEWRSLILEGDRLWLAGELQEAERLYRKAKEPGLAIAPPEAPLPYSDPAALSPEGRVYWREAEEGRERGQESRMLVGLDLLIAAEPDFVLGYVRYAEALVSLERYPEAIALMERAVGRMGDVPELVQVQVETLAVSEHLLEASIAARQFALLYPEHPQAPAFATLADEYLEAFQDDLQDDLRARAIANVLTGTLSFALTGNLYGPLTTLQTTIMLLEGESGMGDTLSNMAARQLPLVEDEALNAYVNDIGQRLAALTGRDEFTYEFFIVDHEALNAFALPGGKIFIFSGAILQTETEAELAGLLAHELAHTVLSHGFQMMADSTLAGNTLQLLPYGGLISNLVLLRYSRDMERQADAFGTRLLATAGYAADGLESLMYTLDETGPEAWIEWLSTHPDTDERIRNIATQIERSRYNRFAYIGLGRHEAMQERLRQVLGLSEESATSPDATPTDTPEPEPAK